MSWIHLNTEISCCTEINLIKELNYYLKVSSHHLSMTVNLHRVKETMYVINNFCFSAEWKGEKCFRTPLTCRLLRQVAKQLADFIFYFYLSYKLIIIWIIQFLHFSFKYSSKCDYYSLCLWPSLPVRFSLPSWEERRRYKVTLLVHLLLFLTLVWLVCSRSACISLHS